MAAQRCNKKFLTEIFCIFELPQNPSSQSSQLSWFLKTTNERLSQTSKTGGFTELFLPKNDFKTCSAVNFPKKTCRFWRTGNQLKALNLDFNCFHMPFYIWSHYKIKIVLAT